MIRTLLVAAALTVAAPAAFAQDFTSDDYANGVTVQPFNSCVSGRAASCCATCLPRG